MSLERQYMEFRLLSNVIQCRGHFCKHGKQLLYEIRVCHLYMQIPITVKRPAGSAELKAWSHPLKVSICVARIVTTSALEVLREWKVRALPSICNCSLLCRIEVCIGILIEIPVQKNEGKC